MKTYAGAGILRSLILAVVGGALWLALSSGAAFAAAGEPCEYGCMLWPLDLTPTTTVNATAETTLGTQFKSTFAGHVTHLRFYKASDSSATSSTLKLWTQGGTELASATWNGLASAGGWQSVALTTPYAITAGTVYVVTYTVASGQKWREKLGSDHWSESPYLTWVGPGRYKTSGGYGFPTSTYAVNYFADVRVSTNTATSEDYRYRHAYPRIQYGSADYPTYHELLHTSRYRNDPYSGIFIERNHNTSLTYRVTIYPVTWNSTFDWFERGTAWSTADVITQGGNCGYTETYLPPRTLGYPLEYLLRIEVLGTTIENTVCQPSRIKGLPTNMYGTSWLKGAASGSASVVYASGNDDPDNPAGTIYAHAAEWSSGQLALSPADPPASWPAPPPTPTPAPTATPTPPPAATATPPPGGGGATPTSTAVPPPPSGNDGTTIWSWPGDIAAAISAGPAAWWAALMQHLVPDPETLQEQHNSVSAAWNAKTNAVGRVVDELGNLRDGLTDGDCNAFSGITMGTPGLLGGGNGSYTVLAEFAPWWCPWKPLADALIKLGTGAGFAAALLRKLNNK